MPFASASAPSSSGPVEAPVQTLIRNGSPSAWAAAIRRASAPGTALGCPAPVKPLIPTVSPGPISAAAASAGTTLRASPGWRIRWRLGTVRGYVPSPPMGGG